MKRLNAQKCRAFLNSLNYGFLTTVQNSMEWYTDNSDVRIH